MRRNEDHDETIFSVTLLHDNLCSKSWFPIFKVYTVTLKGMNMKMTKKHRDIDNTYHIYSQLFTYYPFPFPLLQPRTQTQKTVVLPLPCDRVLCKIHGATETYILQGAIHLLPWATTALLPELVAGAPWHLAKCCPFQIILPLEKLKVYMTDVAPTDIIILIWFIWSTSTSHLLTKKTASPVTGSVGTSAKEDLSDLKQIRKSESPRRGNRTCSSTEKLLFFQCIKALKQSPTSPILKSMLVPLVKLTLDHPGPPYQDQDHPGGLRCSAALLLRPSNHPTCRNDSSLQKWQAVVYSNGTEHQHIQEGSTKTDCPVWSWLG